MEGLLILLLICLPLAWTVLLIVAVCQNSGLSDRMKQALESLEKRLDRQQETLLKALDEFRRGSGPTSAQPPDLQAAPEAVVPLIDVPPPPEIPAVPVPPPSSPPVQAVSTPPAAVIIPPPPPLPVMDGPVSETVEPPAVQLPEGFLEPDDFDNEPPMSEADLREFRPPPKQLDDDTIKTWMKAGRAPAGIAAAAVPSIVPAAEEAAIAEGPPVPVAPQAPAAPPVPPEPTWLERSFSSARDFLMRDGHFWVVAGVFVLFLGASFFVRHGIAMGWFPPAMRLTATFIVGLALTGVGLAVRNRKPSWALVVQGCGLALMYLTVVASVRVYELVGQGPALTVMTALVAVTAVLALWQNSQIVAHLSIVAGFVAPLLVSEDSGNYVGLFSFYIVLNLGILGMCLVRPWRRLYLTGFSLSFGLFGLWVATSYRPEFFNSSVPFLVAFYLFYVFIGLYTARNRSLDEAEEEPPKRRFRTDMTLTVMAPILFLSTLAAMAYKPYTLAIAAALSGAMYLALFFGLRDRYLPPLTSRIIMWQGLIGLNLGLALFLFDLKPEALSRWTILSLTWSVEGAMLYYIGQIKHRKESINFGLGCLGLSALFAWSSLDWQAGRFASQFLIAGLVLGGALLHAAWSGLKFAGEDHPPAPGQPCPGKVAFRSSASDAETAQPGPSVVVPGQPPLIILALLAWGLVPAIEAVRLAALVDYQYGLNWLAIVWSLLAAALWALTRRVPVLLTVGEGPKTDPGWTVPALIAARIGAFILVLAQARALLGVYLGLPAHSWTVAGWWEALAWTLFFVSQTLAIQQARLYRSARIWTNLWSGSLVLTLGWLLFSLAARLHLPAPLPDLARLTVLLAALALIVFPPPVKLAREMSREFLTPATCFLAALALWHFAAMIDDPAQTVWLPYVPVLNLIDLFQAAAVIMPLAALYRLAQAERPELSRPIVYALGILLFIWINLVVGRGVHHYVGVPYYYEALFRSGHFQSLAALVWGVAGIAAMITGHRSARRTPWLLGAVLLVADLAKIFFIDLSKVGTVARIVSFVAVGTVLILVGYFAPLPPASTAAEVTPSSRKEGDREPSDNERARK